MESMRDRIISEARTWLGTPFHHEARVKKVGVDCLQLIKAVYETVGVVEKFEVEHYPADWHFHRNDERYLHGVMKYASEVTTPRNGDVEIFKFGRCFSHGALVVEWPGIIHAFWSAKYVLEARADLHPLKNRPVKFFDAIRD